MSQQVQVVEGYRLSPQQKRSWAMSGLGTAQCVIRLEGALDMQRLVRALEQIVDHHEILRTSFSRLPGIRFPVQVINKPGLVSWRFSTYSDGEELAAEERRLRDEQQQPVRFALCAVAERAHLLVVTLSSLCADTKTMTNLVTEISRAYESNYAEEAVQYLQYAEWQNELLAEETPEAAQEYWREVAQRYRNVTSLRLPLEPPSAREEFRPQSVRRSLDTEVVGAAAMTRRQLEVTPRAFWLSCWLLLLQRLTGAERVVTGCVFDGRVYEELQAALGPYARALPVGAEFNGCSFAELCRQVEHELEENEEWQHYYRAEETAAHGFGFEYVEVPEEQVGAVRVRLERWSHWMEANKVRLRCEQWASGEVAVELGYDGALYEREQIERLAERYEQVVRAVALEEVKDVRAVEVVGATERRQLIEEWSVDADVAAETSNIVELFEAALRNAGAGRIAVESEEGRLSYEELNERANRLGRYLRSECGVQSEEVVAIALGRGLLQVVAVLGVLKAGGAYLPLDVALPEARLELMLREAGVRVLLTEQRLRERFPKLAHVIALDSEWQARVARHEPTDLDVKPSVDNLAYVIYTSGSTGTPKAVMIEHGAVLNLVAALRERIYRELGSGQRVSLNAPLHFDASVKQLMQLTCGHTLCVVPETVRLDGAAMRAWVKAQAVTVLDCTPSQLRLLLEGAAVDWMTGVVLVGGEAIDERLWRQLREQVGVQYYNVYGPTECTVDATACTVDEAEAPVLGRALPGVRVYVLDPRQRLAPIGVAGELYIGGRGVGRGYLKRGDLTAERYVPDEWSGAAGARLYATGDMVRYLTGGALEYVGRADRQVKVRGHRVELGEIETVLREHAGVAAAVVELGAEESLVAYVVAPPQGNGIAKELREHVRGRLPEYMTPGRYVEVATMPLTRSGKVDREELRRLAESNGHTEVDEPLPDPPKTAIERTIVGIWQEVLRKDKVGVNDNFFELGGHSLLMVQAHNKLQETFKRKIPMVEIFKHPTINSLSRFLSSGEQTSFQKTAERVEKRRRASGRRRALPQK